MSGLGRQLKEAREKMRVTVTEAASSTHLKMLVIDAMERDDYPKLIAPTYAKGFYRLYCEYLGLDAEPFVEAYLHFAGVSDDKTELIRDPKKKPGLFSGLQKKMKEMQDKKDVQRKAKEIAEAQEKARQLGQRRAEVPAARPAGQQELPLAEPDGVPAEEEIPAPFEAPVPAAAELPPADEPAPAEEPPVEVAAVAPPPKPAEEPIRRGRGGSKKKEPKSPRE